MSTVPVCPKCKGSNTVYVSAEGQWYKRIVRLCNDCNEHYAYWQDVRPPEP